MKRLLIAILALSVSACATLQNPINTTRLAQVESAYGIALSLAVGYYELYKVNRCTTTRLESATNICARRSVVIKLQQADRTAQVALQSAQKFVHNNPNLDAGALIDAANLAVDAFRQVEAANGVH